MLYLCIKTLLLLFMKDIRILTPSQDELIEGLRTGDRAVMTWVYKNYKSIVVRYVVNNGGNSEEALDIFQDAIITTYEKLRDEKLVLNCSVATYISAVARNLWLKKWNQKSKVAPLMDDLNELIIDDIVPFEELDEASAKLVEELNLLGDKCRAILRLYYYEKKNMEEIAIILGYTNADNVKNQKYRCLRQLKSKFI